MSSVFKQCFSTLSSNKASVPQWIGIACVNYNSAIGYKQRNSLVYHIPQELRLFREITTYSPNDKPNVVIMGSQTWNSLPMQPLPRRLNCVLTTNAEYYRKCFGSTTHSSTLDTPEFFSSVPECLSYLTMNSSKYNNVYVIGGKTIYEYFLERGLLDYVYLTHILTPNNEGDVYFPTEYIDHKWAEIYQQDFPSAVALNPHTNETKELDLLFRVYQNRQPITHKLEAMVDPSI